MNQDLSIVTLVLHASWVVQLVIAGLLIFLALMLALARPVWSGVEEGAALVLVVISLSAFPAMPFASSA